jgi:phosphatidylglycerol:prolipoprotein diacylglycerol transferase
MRPTIVEWLQTCGLHPFAGIVPSPGVVYSLAIIGVNPAGWLEAPKGTVSWGAYLGALAGLLGYTGIRAKRPWVYVDMAASCAPLGSVIGRFACFLAGDDFGRVTQLPWGITFPHASPPFVAHLNAALILPGADRSLPVHPLQIGLAVNALVVFLAVSAIWRRTAGQPGVTLGAYLALYGGTRFFWEFLRDPAAGGAAAGLSVSQVMCVLFVAGGGAVLVSRLARRVQPAARGLTECSRTS